MKLIESKAEYIPQEEGLEGIYEQIELAGRTAYHSQDKITPDSAKDFVDRMIKSKHGAALEHGTVYLKISIPSKAWNRTLVNKYYSNPYSKVNNTFDDLDYHYFICTNYRVLVENNWLDDLKYLCSPTEFHEKRYTMRFTCSRAIAQELTRHRVFSFLMESQRYINYSKERHGGEITFIQPYWADFSMGKMKEKEISEQEVMLVHSLQYAEAAYFVMLDEGFQPQQARDVLPNATKTELIMTGFASDWRHVMDLRLFEKTGKVHPDMLDLIQKAQKAMQEAGIWDDIMKYPSNYNYD